MTSLPPESATAPAASSRQPSKAARENSDKRPLVRDESRKLRHSARWTLRLLLALALCVATLHGGGADWTTQLVVWVLLLAGVPAAFLAVPHKAPRMRLGIVWWALGMWTAVQVVPLPHFVVALIQPLSTQIADAGRAALGLDAPLFLPLAVAPGDAALQGATYLLAGVFALLSSIALQGHDGRDAIHWAIGVVIVVAALSGLAWVTAYTWPVTAYVPPSLSNALSAFCLVNPNQEAGLLNLGMGLSLGRMTLAANSRWQTVFGSIAVFLAAVVLEVGSRGGVLTAGLVLCSVGLLTPRPFEGRRIDPRRLQASALSRLALIIAAVALLAAVIALPALDREFSEGNDSHKLQTLARMAGLGHTDPKGVGLLAASWRAGLGPGGFPVLIGMDPSWGALRYDFAENMVLDHIFNAGILIGGLFLGTVAWVVRGWYKRRKGVPQSPGPIAALSGVLVANFVDFSLQISGVLLPFLASATALERALPPPGGRDNQDEIRLPTFRRTLAGAILGLVVAAWLLHGALNALSRNSEAVLSGVPTAEAKALVADRFLSDHHAFYVYGRKLYDEGDAAGAVRALDRALALRPHSAHARLFRLAALLKSTTPKRASDDLVWIITHSPDDTERALRLLAQAKEADAILVDTFSQKEDLSHVAHFLLKFRPALVERVAYLLRVKFPQRVFLIEFERGMDYLDHGDLTSARRIASTLMSTPPTQDYGYALEALLLAKDGKHYEAFHLMREVCDHKPDWWLACPAAVEQIVAANRPDEALKYVNKRAPLFPHQPHWMAFTWYQKGLIARQTDRFEDALEAFRRAHGFSPADPAIGLALAETCIRVGLRDEAQQLVEEVLVSHPKLESAKTLLRELDRESHNDLPSPSTLPPATTPSIL